jgi:hypothetical protein
MYANLLSEAYLWDPMKRKTRQNLFSIPFYEIGIFPLVSLTFVIIKKRGSERDENCRRN